MVLNQSMFKFKFMKTSFLAILMIAILSITGCDSDSGTNILDQKLESGAPFFSIIYSQEFAKRFSLDRQKAIELPEYFKAIAVEINKEHGIYTCNLHLYIDNTLDVYYPVDGAFFSHITNLEQFFISSYNDLDQSWNSRNIERNSMRIKFLSSKEVNPRFKFTRTLSYTRIHKSFLPGLSVVSLNTHCGLFNQIYYPANIWIQKQNVGDYLVGNDGGEEVLHKDNNQRFPIPMELIDQIQPYIEIAEKHNSEKLHESFNQ